MPRVTALFAVAAVAARGRCGGSGRKWGELARAQKKWRPKEKHTDTHTRTHTHTHTHIHTHTHSRNLSGPTRECVPQRRWMYRRQLHLRDATQSHRPHPRSAHLFAGGQTDARVNSQTHRHTHTHTQAHTRTHTHTHTVKPPLAVCMAGADARVRLCRR